MPQTKLTEMLHDTRLMSLCLLVLATTAAGLVCVWLAPLLQPLFIALFLYFLIRPGADWLAARKVPRMLSYALMVLALLAADLGIGILVYQNVAELESKLPHYKAEAIELMDSLARRTGVATDDGRFNWQKYPPSALLAFDDSDAARWVFGSLTGFLQLVMAVMFYLAFIILEGRALPERVRRAFPDQADTAIEIGRKIAVAIQRYIRIKVGISLGTAFTCGLICYLGGIEHWLMWGVLTFLFNFIPYVGSFIASMPPVALAFLVAGPKLGLVIMLLLGVNQVVWGNLLEPLVAGKQLGVSPLALLINVAFWGWIWGVIGMVLAVPLMVSLMIVLENLDRTRPLVVMLGRTDD